MKVRLSPRRDHPMAHASVDDYKGEAALIIEHQTSRWVIRNKEDYNQFVSDYEQGEPFSFICSSSCDFPEDETDNQELIELVNFFRNPPREPKG